MAAKKIEIPPKRLRFYDQLVSANSEIERKGKTVPYTSVNGHMFSFLRKDGIMGLRLSEEERVKFIEKFDTNLIESHGTIMKEYVEIPERLIEDADTLIHYLNASFEYVKTLKPK